MKEKGMFYRAVRRILTDRGATWEELAAACGKHKLTIMHRLTGPVTPATLDLVGGALGGHSGAWLLSQAWAEYRRLKAAGADVPMPRMMGEHTPDDPGQQEG
jgi:hypothetical protein